MSAHFNLLGLLNYNNWPFGLMPAAAMTITVWEYSKAAILSRSSTMEPLTLGLISAPSFVTAAAWSLGLTDAMDHSLRNFVPLQVFGGSVFLFSIFVLCSNSTLLDEALSKINARTLRQKLQFATYAFFILGTVILMYHLTVPFLVDPKPCIYSKCRAGQLLLGGSKESSLGTLWGFSLIGSAACATLMLTLRSILGPIQDH